MLSSYSASPILSTGDTIFSFNMLNWTDPDYINFKVFMLVDSVYQTLTAQVPQNLPFYTPTTIYFRVPILDSTQNYTTTI